MIEKKINSKKPFVEVYLLLIKVKTKKIKWIIITKMIIK